MTVPALAVPAALGPGGPESRGNSRSRVRVLIWVAAFLVIGSLVTASVTGWVKYSHSQTHLASTRVQLDQSSRSLASTRSELSDTNKSLSTTKNTLSSTQNELTRTKAALKSAEGSLNNAQDRLDLQASQIDTLQTCLNGVTDALSYAASGFYGAAVSSLQAVQGACTDAHNIL